MELVHTIAEVRRAVADARTAGKNIGLVPTMGALHAGHASLVDAARKRCGFVVVSVFVNPTQFGPNEDLAKYPRTLEDDCYLCLQHQADLVFAPSADEMYPPGGNLTEVTIKKLGDGLCGASRPGHFTGVCTVVSKLFNIAQPDQAFFGAKDFQQATIIRQMAADLDFPLEIVICPIVREAEGLAMSSRNRNLSPEHRRQAVALSASLSAARREIESGKTQAGAVQAAIRQYIATHAPAGQIDYVEVVDARSLTPVETIAGEVLIALAVKFGGTRLIDNMVVDSAAGPS